MDAIEFLKTIKPDKPWLLSAINPDGSIETELFTDEENAQRWINFKNGSANLYYHVNSTASDFVPKKGGRAKQEDIEFVDFLHVDIDPRDRPDLKEAILAGDEKAIAEMKQHNKDERDRIFRELTTTRPAMVPEPSFIVDSGGGYQALWALTTAHDVYDDEAREAARLRNKQLEVLFKADRCHNLDRLMRLPGTINIPNKKKREKCREETEAKVVRANPLSYDFKDFVEAVAEPKHTTRIPIEISGNIEPVQSAEDLDVYLDATDWSDFRKKQVKLIMLEGKGRVRKDEDPETRPKDTSSSGWVFQFVCECARAGVPDDVIYSIITDPEWAVAKHVLEQKNVQRYALRQIERAKERAIDDDLEMLNGKHCVIADFGGKLRVMRTFYDEILKRESFSMQPKQDFLGGYENRRKESLTPTGKPTTVSLGEWWFRHPNRRQYDRIVFEPGIDAPEGCLNLWTGFDAEDVPGSCDKFLAHIRDNICAVEFDPTLHRDEADRDAHEGELYEYFLDWVANMVQNPGQPGHTALVLSGDQGIGKGFLVKRIGELVGKHFLQITNSAHLVGNFNAHLANTLLLFADEAFYANDPKGEAVLKGLITEETIALERKNIDVVSVPNFLHIIMATNEKHAVSISSGERRFVLFDVSDKHKEDTDYFGAIADEWDNGGKDAFFHMMRHRELGDFHPGNRPRVTPAQKRNMEFSLGPVENWWLDKLVNGVVFPSNAEWNDRAPTQSIYEDFLSYCNKRKIKYPKAQNRFGIDFNHVVDYKKSKMSVPIITEEGEKTVQRNCYIFGTLQECRNFWDEKIGKVEWDE